MGFKDVIWTLYRYSGDNEKVLSYLPSMDLLGLTMDRTRANAGLARKAFKATGVRSWVHTINTEEEFRHYLNQGISSIYTDWLH